MVHRLLKEVKKKNQQKWQGVKETYRRGQHTATKPDCISLHVVRNHLHIHRFGLWSGEEKEEIRHKQMQSAVKQLVNKKKLKKGGLLFFLI